MVFYRISLILHLSVVSSAGVGAIETLSDNGVSEQCQSDASMGSEQSEGHALLSTRSKLQRVVTEGNPATSSLPLTSELMLLSKELSVGQLDKVEKAVELLRSMKDNSTQRRQEQPPDEGVLEPSKEADTIPEVKEEAERTYVLAKFIVVPISCVFFFVYTISTLMEKYEITAIPESGIVIMVGVVLGFFMKKFAHFDFFENDEAWGELNVAMLNLMFLPIIIFASGWSLRRHDFYSQLPYILLFAVVGTGISTCCVAGLIRVTGQMQLHKVIGWRAAFTYASLISATDPVATLTTYSKLKVHPLLNIMVFGESTVNDAVAIVLFKVFNSNELMGDPATGGELSFSGQLLGNIMWGIFKSFFGSLCMGVGLGMLYCVIARVADMKQNKKGQILVIFVSCYLTYAAAETVGLSGIIAEIFCSLVMAVYMKPFLSTEGIVLTTFFVKQISTLADSAVFLLVGVSVAQLTTNGWRFGLWVMGFCVIARFCATIPIAYLVNALKAARGTAAGQEPDAWNLLTPYHMFMMWHGGLRGGIALALAWELGKWVDVAEAPGTRHALQTATFLVILVFLIIFGGSTSTCLKACGIEMGKDYPENCLSKTEYRGFGHVQGGLKWLDMNVLKPVLVGKENMKEGENQDDENYEDVGDAEDLLKKSMALHKFCQH